MNFSLFNKDLCDRMMELGLAIPTENMENYEIPEEDAYKVFRSQFMTSKDEVLSYLGTKKEELYTKLYAQVKASNLFEAPKGYWCYEVEEDSQGVGLKLIEVKGYVGCDLEYVIEEVNYEYTMFRVDSNKVTN